MRPSVNYGKIPILIYIKCLPPNKSLLLNIASVTFAWEKQTRDEKKIAEIKKSAQKKKRVSRHVNSLLAPLESRTKTHAGCKKKTREWILTSINWLRYGFSLEESVRRWFKALRELRMTCFSCIKISHSIYWHNWFVF